jgi:hypothetical protein
MNMVSLAISLVFLLSLLSINTLTQIININKRPAFPCQDLYCMDSVVLHYCPGLYYIITSQIHGSLISLAFLRWGEGGKGVELVGVFFDS